MPSVPAQSGNVCVTELCGLPGAGVSGCAALGRGPACLPGVVFLCVKGASIKLAELVNVFPKDVERRQKTYPKDVNPYWQISQKTLFRYLKLRITSIIYFK